MNSPYLYRLEYYEKKGQWHLALIHPNMIAENTNGWKTVEKIVTDEEQQEFIQMIEKKYKFNRWLKKYPLFETIYTEWVNYKEQKRQKDTTPKIKLGHLSRIREKINMPITLENDDDFAVDLLLRMSFIDVNEIIYPTESEQKAYDKGFKDGSEWYREQLKQRK